MSQTSLAHHCELLGLQASSIATLTIDAIDQAYSRRVMHLIQNGNDQVAKHDLYVAYEALKTHVLELAQDADELAAAPQIPRQNTAQENEGENEGENALKHHLSQANTSQESTLPESTLPASGLQENESQESTPQQQIATWLNQKFRYLSIATEVKWHGTEVQIFLQGKGALKSEIAAEISSHLNTYLNLFHLTEIKTVQIYGLRGQRSIAWKKQFTVSSAIASSSLSTDDTDLFSFNNRHVINFAIPIAFVIAFITNAVPLFKILLIGMQIWIHEFGHATVAWLAGRQATPLPFGWTNVGEGRSLFVYFGILTLLGLFYHTGLQEGKKWIMGVAGGLALIQFYMTWMMSVDRFQMWLSFGGVGGEFYLSALLIISFYFPLPEKWRWDFCRYIVLLIASHTFWSTLGTWQNIKRGVDSIPWGTLFGGEGDAGGDMNQLSEVYGWSDRQIIDTYHFLGNFCLFCILGVYAYFLLRHNPKLRSMIYSR